MVFSSISFLFIFLPFVFIFYLLIPFKFRFVFLLFANLFFYFWGEGKYIEIMIYSIFLNYISGILLEKLNQSGENDRKIIFLTIPICLNLLLLIYFKYLNFITQSLIDVGFTSLQNPNIHLPIGISFFTFQGISYLIDIYRKNVQGTKNFIHFAMYISLFSQLIAGPIVRYKDIENDILQNHITHQKIVYGLKRFIIGLAKKVIISNTLAALSDQIFGINPNEISTWHAWLGAICYSLQIYFDFSGYSDMAIGLGYMFGFRFLENFNYPYLSKSMQEFWRRWHISLSTWFRDYLFIPLGGSNVGKNRLYLNLMIVFLLCGIWHGANWTFIVLGIWHGFFLVLERLQIFQFLKTMNSFLKHLYTLLIVMIGWILFRADNLDTAIIYIRTLFIYKENVFNLDQYTVLKMLNPHLIFIIALGLIAATPIGKYSYEYLKESKIGNAVRENNIMLNFVSTINLIYFIALFIFCISYLASGTYNPFIYFRF